MPHFTTFDNFASKAIVHPQFQDGSKAIVHPQFQEAAKAIVPPQFQPEAGRAIVHPQFQPEADGFMKLGDIKGEFSPSREVDGISNQQAQLRNGIRDVDVGAEMLLPGTANRAVGGTAGPGGSTFSTGADGLGLFGNEADALTKGGQEGEELVSDYWSPTPACDIGETCTPTCAAGFAADALVQQVNDFAGLINPDSMRPAEYFSHNPEWFAPGSAVDSWTEKTFGNGDGEILGGISQGNVFAPINVLRNGYDCEGAGAC